MLHVFACGFRESHQSFGGLEVQGPHSKPFDWDATGTPGPLEALRSSGNSTPRQNPTKSKPRNGDRVHCTAPQSYTLYICRLAKALTGEASQESHSGKRYAKLETHAPEGNNIMHVLP